jgi:integration host factor subunit beta
VIKSELVYHIAACSPQLHQREVENVIDAILGGIADALERGQRVELRGFGASFTKQRQGRTRRNPHTGNKVSVAEKSAPPFVGPAQRREISA